MNDERNLRDLLAAEPVDTGCAAGFETLHEYVELELRGGATESVFPSLAAHLRRCPACRDDHAGLVEMVTRFGDARPRAGPDL